MHIVEVLKAVGDESSITTMGYTITELILSILAVVGNSLQAVSLYRKQRNCHEGLILSLTMLCILTGLISTAIAVARLNMMDMEADKEILVVFFLYLALIFAILSSASHMAIIDFEQIFLPGFPFGDCLQTPKMKKLVTAIGAWLAPASLTGAVQFYPPLASELTIGFSIALLVSSIWIIKKFPICSGFRSLFQGDTNAISQQKAALTAFVLSVCCMTTLFTAMFCIGKPTCKAFAIRMCILINAIVNPLLYLVLMCGNCCVQEQPARYTTTVRVQLKRKSIRRT